MLVLLFSSFLKENAINSECFISMVKAHVYIYIYICTYVLLHCFTPENVAELFLHMQKNFLTSKLENNIYFHLFRNKYILFIPRCFNLWIAYDIFLYILYANIIISLHVLYFCMLVFARDLPLTHQLTCVYIRHYQAEVAFR